MRPGLSLAVTLLVSLARAGSEHHLKTQTQKCVGLRFYRNADVFAMSSSIALAKNIWCIV